MFIVADLFFSRKLFLPGGRSAVQTIILFTSDRVNGPAVSPVHTGRRILAGGGSKVMRICREEMPAAVLRSAPVSGRIAAGRRPGDRGREKQTGFEAKARPGGKHRRHEHEGNRIRQICVDGRAHPDGEMRLNDKDWAVPSKALPVPAARLRNGRSSRQHILPAGMLRSAEGEGGAF